MQNFDTLRLSEPLPHVMQVQLHRPQARNRRVGQEVEALYLNGPAAGGGVTQSVREVIAAASALVPREAARQAVTLMEA